MAPKPSPRDVVKMLMVSKPDTNRDIHCKRGNRIRRNVPHSVFACPRGENCTSGGDIVFERNSGFTNPYKHLKNCISDSDEQHLLDCFFQRRKEKSQFGANELPTVSFTATSRERAMCSYVKLVVLKSMPISIVKDDDVREFAKYDQHFSRKHVTSVLSKLTELVEKKISAEMDKKKGAIVHDGWSHNGTHFYGVFASYMRDVPYFHKGVEQVAQEHVMPLISVSPLCNTADTMTDISQTEADYSTRFDAFLHVRQLEDIFHFFKLDVHTWVLCSVADNCNVNKAIARLLDVPHVGCMSHKLNLEVNAMISADVILTKTIDSIHETMANCRRRLSNRAMLRNLTNLSPVLPNATRWSGIFQMLKRFIDIRDEILTVADKDGATVTIDRSTQFMERAKKYVYMMAEINTVTVELQRRGASLSDCRLAVDTLIDAINDSKNNGDSKFRGCRMSFKYISPIAATMTHPHFESGVTKIQRDETSTLTNLEKEACTRLEVDSSNYVPAENEYGTTMAEQIAARKRRRTEWRQSYQDCSFILGSAAEVERLWSVCKNILSDNRNRLTPMLFESLVFLKVNKSYWDLSLVRQAMREASRERAAN